MWRQGGMDASVCYKRYGVGLSYSLYNCYLGKWLTGYPGTAYRESFSNFAPEPELRMKQKLTGS